MRDTYSVTWLAVRRAGFLFTLLIMSVGCGAAAAPSTSDAPYTITTDKAGDAVTPAPGEGEVVFDITSKSGIGRAEISRPDGQWPERVELRLHLQGLESLKVTYGDVVVHTAVPSAGGKMVDQTVQRPDQPSPRTALDSRYEMALDVYDADGQTDIPLDNGYFSLWLPLDFRAGGHTTFTVDWIDFYR